MSSCRVAIVLGLVALAGSVQGPARAIASEAGKTAGDRLIETYSPRVEIREQQHPPCDTTEEQYKSTKVDTVLGNPSVVLEVEGPERRPHGGEEGADRGRRRQALARALPASPRRRPAARFGVVRILAFSDLHRDLDQAASLVEMSAKPMS